ncbi:MAG: terminase small subunit [Kiloniellaceae bacterium]
MTPRQRRFVEEYLIDLNASRAARRAGYSARSASAYGPRLLRRPEVAAAIAEAQAARVKRTRVDADRVVEELAKVAFGDPRKLFSWGPRGVVLRDSGELTEAEAALVSEVSESRTAAGGTRRVKLHCKLSALTALAKHLGLFNGGRLAGRAAGVAAGEDGGAGPADDARQRLARRIARIAARSQPGETARGTD